MSPSPFFVQQTALLSDAGQRGPVLDLACGRGRHCIAVAEGGAYAVGVDRRAQALTELRNVANARGLHIHGVRADLESDPELPLAPGCCGAVLVFRFLFRPLAPRIEEVLQPGGVLLYETFTVRQRELGGGPHNPAFLLGEGELPQLFPRLQVLEFWEGIDNVGSPAALARLVARKPRKRGRC